MLKDCFVVFAFVCFVLGFASICELFSIVSMMLWDWLCRGRKERK